MGEKIRTHTVSDDDYIRSKFLDSKIGWGWPSWCVGVGGISDIGPTNQIDNRIVNKEFHRFGAGITEGSTGNILGRYLERSTGIIAKILRNDIGTGALKIEWSPIECHVVRITERLACGWIKEEKKNESFNKLAIHRWFIDKQCQLVFGTLTLFTLKIYLDKDESRS